MYAYINIYLYADSKTYTMCMYIYVHMNTARHIPYMSSRIYLRKRRVDYRVPYFEVRRSFSLANEIGTEHRTRSMHMMYHT